MNFIDKMIMAIDPQKGLKRYEARKKLEILNTGYSNHGASTTKKSMVGIRLILWFFFTVTVDSATSFSSSNKATDKAVLEVSNANIFIFFPCFLLCFSIITQVTVSQKRTFSNFFRHFLYLALILWYNNSNC